MDDDHQCTPFFWESYSQDEGMMEEFRLALLHAKLEREKTLESAKDEIAWRDSELVRLKDRLSMLMGERDEARSRSQALQLENLVLRQQLGRSRDDSPTPQYPVPVSPGSETRTQSSSPQAQGEVDFERLAAEMPLPEKGKLLQAVIDAGPILQTLMLAGPLPRWQRPPPHIDVIPYKRGLESDPNGGTPASPRIKCMKMIS
ncbi:hypothetical protein MLD38_002549 [Melastoma candidum]|uniref:Uncharacterized protein n=1 Tax=Melastoma candidum TaxID=119954 RepID=A0ACB9RZX2_9MYRT|nr:hypothetical protein MLD38_002549 [Melastoma candidum]